MRISVFQTTRWSLLPVRAAAAAAVTMSAIPGLALAHTGLEAHAPAHFVLHLGPAAALALAFALGLLGAAGLGRRLYRRIRVRQKAR